jgi:hypothetical protein
MVDEHLPNEALWLWRSSDADLTEDQVNEIEEGINNTGDPRPVSGTGWRTTARRCAALDRRRAERTGILVRTRARTLMESGKDDPKRDLGYLLKALPVRSSPKRGHLSLFRLYFGLISSAKPTSERCVVDEEGQ